MALTLVSARQIFVLISFSLAAAIYSGCSHRVFSAAGEEGSTTEAQRPILSSARRQNACGDWRGNEIPPASLLPADFSRRVACWRDVIVPRVVASAGGPWVAAGLCADYTMKWLQALRAKGYSVDYAQTEGFAEVQVNGAVRKLDKTHVFVADRGLCGEGQSSSASQCADEILIDPTWTQFLEGGECLDDATDAACAKIASAVRAAPRVFVGRPTDAPAFYEPFRTYLRWDVSPGADANVGRYDPASFTRLLYSYGAASGLRTNLRTNL